jgi:glycosyltransferase involved in cell wall biosynthesis
MPRRVFLVDLEPLEERYTGQWARWMPEMLAPFGEVVLVQGEPLAGTIEAGAFLDLYSHAHYQAGQLAAIAKLFRSGVVRAGDLFWFSDIEFPGMEQVRYLALLSGIPVRIAGFLHAASYTRGDFMQAAQSVGRYAELAWLAACDAVCVGSAHHKRELVRARLMPTSVEHLAERVHATGNPFRSHEVCSAIVPRAERTIDVLYPHRPDAEKRPDAFLPTARALAQRGFSVAFTTGRATYRSTNAQASADAILALAAQHPAQVKVHVGLTRRAFYALLGAAKVVVSTTLEENFGYAMVEAIACGALPYMPARYSHPELVRAASELAQERVLYSREPDADALTALAFSGSEAWDDSRGAVLAHLDGAERRIQAVLGGLLA